MIEMTFLMVPIDVSNVRYDGGFNMKVFWYVVLMVMAFFIFVFMPLALLFYESEGLEMVSSQSQSSEIENLVCGQVGVLYPDLFFALHFLTIWVSISSRSPN